MSKNPDFMNLFARNVELQYPKLDQTYRYNNNDQRSEPCAQTAAGAAWSVAWKMSEAEGKEFHGLLKKHYESCRARNDKLPAFSKVFGFKKNDDGTVSFSSKRRGVSSEGKPNKEPTVIDADKNALANRRIWSGSKGSVSVIAFPTKDPEGNAGISLILDKVQVTEPVYGGGNLDGFDQAPASDKAEW